MQWKQTWRGKIVSRCRCALETKLILLKLFLPLCLKFFFLSSSSPPLSFIMWETASRPSTYPPTSPSTEYVWYLPEPSVSFCAKVNLTGKNVHPLHLAPSLRVIMPNRCPVNPIMPLSFPLKILFPSLNSASSEIGDFYVNPYKIPWLVENLYLIYISARKWAIWFECFLRNVFF